MFPATVEFQDKIVVTMKSDSLQDAQLLKPLEIAYGHTVLVVPTFTVYHDKLRLPRLMQLVLWWTCRHDQQIKFIAEAGVRGVLKVLYDDADKPRYRMVPTDLTEIVCDLLEADGVSLRIRKMIQPRLLKEVTRNWGNHATA
jgi:hypothetical protein